MSVISPGCCSHLNTDISLNCSHLGISTVIFFISTYWQSYLCISIICHWHICVCSLRAFANRHSITTFPFFSIQNQAYFQKQFWACLLCNPALLQLRHPVPGNGLGSDFEAPYENTLPKRMDIWCGLIGILSPIFCIIKIKSTDIYGAVQKIYHILNFTYWVFIFSFALNKTYLSGFPKLSYFSGCTYCHIMFRVATN